MRAVVLIAAAALAAMPRGTAEPFEHAPPAPQSRLALAADWIAYTELVDGAPQVTARRLGDAAGAPPMRLFRPPAGTMALASAFSPDGQRLYLESNARSTPEAGREDSDVWIAERDGDGWGTPRPLGGAWATRFNEHAPTADATGTLCINSARPEGIGENDVYCGRLPDGPPRLLPRVNSPEQDAFPTLAPAGDALVFASDRPGGLGGWDLYVTWREDDAWSRPHNLGAPINSASDELGPTIVPGAARLVFTRASGEGNARVRQILVMPFTTRRLSAQQ